MKIYYHTLCGCILERHELINGPSSVNRRLICKEHHEIIKAKSCFCKKCGKRIIHNSPSGRLPPLCEECNPPKAKVEEDLVELSEQAFNALLERSDCVYRPLCFEVFIKEDLLPCLGCFDYQSKDPLCDLEYKVDLKELDETTCQILETLKRNQKQLEKQALLKWGPLYEKRKRDLRRHHRFCDAG